MSRLTGFFITGTDTGIGKTWISCGLIMALRTRGYKVMGMKPVASGCSRTCEGLRNEDALSLQGVSSISVPYESVNPFAFEPPIAPHIAARETGIAITFAAIRARAEQLMQQADYLVVEGVGGWRVPLGADGDVAALTARLGLPVVLVVGVRLGCLNHAFLSVEAIIADDLPLAGWIANVVDTHTERLAENIETLRNGIAAPCWGVVPFMPECRFDRLAACLTPQLPDKSSQRAGGTP